MNKNEQYNGYFSANKLDECVSDSVFQELVGVAGATYTLGIDPSFSLLDEGDEFALVLIKNGKSPIVVHNYAVSGISMKKHLEYIQYLIKYFNIKDIYSTAELFLDNVQVTAIKLENNILRKLNEYLQYLIDYKKIIFAESLYKLDGAEFDFLMTKDGYDKIPPIQENKPFSNIYSFVEQQAEWMDKLKIQIKCIEAKSSFDGSMSWGLPGEMRRSRNKHRLRQDSYMALLAALYKMSEEKSEQNAKVTRSSFNEAAKTAEKLASQVLSAEETIKRLNDALILSKLAKVDNKFAEEAGDSFCELLDIVAKTQRQASRGGAVIGNALKTIRTKINSCGATIEFLDKIGIKTSSSAWETIQDIRSKWVYFNEDTREKVAYLVAGTQNSKIAKVLFSV